jgi:hypothetical protein
MASFCSYCSSNNIKLKILSNIFIDTFIYTHILYTFIGLDIYVDNRVINDFILTRFFRAILIYLNLFNE